MRILFAYYKWTATLVGTYYIIVAITHSSTAATIGTFVIFFLTSKARYSDCSPSRSS